MGTKLPLCILRGTTFYSRRRLPSPFKMSVEFSLGTKDLRVARGLSSMLTIETDRAFAVLREGKMTPEQVDTFARQKFAGHSARLGAVHQLARDRQTPWQDEIVATRAAAIAMSLLAHHGRSAQLSDFPGYLPAVAQNGSAVVPRSGSGPAIVGNRKTRRAIKKVIDLRGVEPVIMPVDALLDGMTAVDLTAVRRAIAHERGEGNILFRCGQCNSPRQLSSSRESSTGDGRGAFFKHSYRTPEGCSWYTAEAPRSTGAKQFAGLQEGEPHWRLKNLLADSIRCDPDFSKPVVDKHFIQIGDGHRKPDVFTTHKGKPIALELQLARMPLTTITERTAAYRAVGITLVWVTSAHELALLNNQNFRDLYLAAGGRILAVDAASYERSEETSVLHLRELSLEPAIQHPFAIYNRWRSRMAGPEVILMPEGQRHALPVISWTDAKGTRSESLLMYVRNSIHHPDNQHRPRHSEEQLAESIRLMCKLVSK